MAVRCLIDIRAGPE